MSFWVEDPELFIHKGKDGVVHVLRCKKEMTTFSPSSMLMKPEDFTDEGAVTELQSLTGACFHWDKNKFEDLIDYMYPRNLLVNCHGFVIVELELELDEKSVLALLLHHLRHQKATVLYMRALDILDMGSYGPGPDHPRRAVPVRLVKYLQDGTDVQTEPTPKEIKLSKEVETLQQELLLAKKMTGGELARNLKLTEELAIKSKDIKTLQQLLAKEKTEMEVLIKGVDELKIEMRTVVPLPKVRIYTKAATDCSLTILNGHQVILGRNNHSDMGQYWVKDDMYGGIVKDIDGCPSFALVNKFTGQALKPINATSNLELVPYDRNVLDKSILWTEHQQGDGFLAIRKATDTSLNMDACADHEKIGDGTKVGLWTWWGGDNQKWYLSTY